MACSESDATPVPPELSMVVDTASPLFGAIDVVPLGARTRAELRSRARTPEDWLEFFAVFAGDSLSLSDTSVAVPGDYSVTPDGARFIPRTRAVAGQTYTARFDSKGLRRFIRASRDYPNLFAQFAVPRDSLATRASVVAIYPATDSVPMNLRRWYIEFSAAMSVGESRSHVRLLDDRGRAVPDAFADVADSQELWDDARRRLTVLFDPGRIKRDLNSGETAGLPLRSGTRYRLVVDSGWKDAAGKPIMRGFEKRFRVGPVDRGSPRVDTWRVVPPMVMTRDPLVISFREPMDHALASRMLVVKYHNGSIIDGTVELLDRDTQWRFTPRALWGTGAHYVEVDTQLEDLAGNNLDGTDSATVRIAFVLKPKALSRKP
jgi:hypothetical protein